MELPSRLAPMLLAATLLGVAGGGAPAGAQPNPPGPTAPAARERQLDGWWARQQEKEAADRFWNGPREQRRAQTRDQIEQWERQRDRRAGRPPYPF